jgi:hypothetical protein
MRRLAPLALVVLLAGCGAPSADLFSVTRSGKDRNANVRLVINDGGTATCNGSKPKALQSNELLKARDLARRLEEQASLSIELPPASNSILRYEVDTEAGRVGFSDTSAHKPQTFNDLIAFTQQVITGVCGIERR